MKSAASTWGGALSDRVGRRRVILAGWGVYALAYAGFAVAASPLAIVALFAFYGLFHALTRGRSARSWPTSPARRRAAARSGSSTR